MRKYKVFFHSVSTGSDGVKSSRNLGFVEFLYPNNCQHSVSSIAFLRAQGPQRDANAVTVIELRR